SRSSWTRRCRQTSRPTGNRQKSGEERMGLGMTRRMGGAIALGAAHAWASGAVAERQPIRVGSKLALTGPLAATGIVHKIVGEIYVEQLNKRGGLLGRPVEWVLLDDQSKPDLPRTLYQHLSTPHKI